MNFVHLDSATQRCPLLPFTLPQATTSSLLFPDSAAAAEVDPSAIGSGKVPTSNVRVLEPHHAIGGCLPIMRPMGAHHIAADKHIFKGFVRIEPADRKPVEAPSGGGCGFFSCFSGSGPACCRSGTGTCCCACDCSSGEHPEGEGEEKSEFMTPKKQVLGGVSVRGSATPPPAVFAKASSGGSGRVSSGAVPDVECEIVRAQVKHWKHAPVAHHLGMGHFGRGLWWVWYVSG